MHENCSALVDVNLHLLGQAEAMLRQLEDEVLQRVGSQMRHVIEFYECFLEGMGRARVDYDARRRDYILEKRRSAAIEKVRSLAHRLEEVRALPGGCFLSVRMEDSDADVWLASSLGRELQALANHTVHHFALIAATLRLHGLEVEADFGVSPSTLRYRSSQQSAATEAA